MMPLLRVALPALLLSGCSLMPALQVPEAPVPAAWGELAPPDGPVASGLAWQDLVSDARLRTTIEQALTGNRDLRLAGLAVSRARAQFQIREAALLPVVNASLSENAQGFSSQVSPQLNRGSARSFNASVGITSWELDLFGRLDSLKTQAMASYLASRENQRAVQLALIAETANAWLTLAGDSEQLALAQDTLRAREESLALITRSADLGVASALDLAQAKTSVEGARADVAMLTSLVARDRHALTLLCGGELPATLMPEALPSRVSELRQLPAGLPSEVLLQRPDILAAERNLEAANAAIGAARAAFFPSITLTGSLGTASSQLSGLFEPGTRVWSVVPQVTLPLFTGGRNQAALDTARTDLQIAAAQYEKTVQTAFGEVADALADQATLDQRVTAREALVAAAAESLRLSEARYRHGLDSHLALLDAQRTHYAARQALISVRQLRLANLLNLYKALGGGTRITGANRNAHESSGEGGHDQQH